MMKKIFIWIFLGLNVCYGYAQKTEDPVVMTIAGKDIFLSEFLFLAQKDSGVNLLDKKSLNSYVELFKTFKLKVADAEAAGIDQTSAFNEELNNYGGQLRASYLSDKEGETKVLRDIYDRGKDILSVSHIIFPLPPVTVSKDTVEVYNKALAVYKRIQGGEDFTTVGKELSAGENPDVFYEDIESVFPLQGLKAFENVVFSMSAGEISTPVRTPLGFHLIRLNRKFTNPGKIRVAHILLGFEIANMPEDELQKKAEEICEELKNGADFNNTVKKYSTDTKTSENGGILPYFGLGEMISPFEKAAFALQNPGDISAPVKTRLGLHIIKLLDRKERAPYAEMEQALYTTMRQGEWNFELFSAFDEREKAKFGYTFNQDAYDDFQRLCDDYFPTDTAFNNRARTMRKVLMHMNDMDFLQDEFAEYLRRYPFSTKTYSGDFLYDVYRLFVRDVVTQFERRTLNDSHPEFDRLVQEYHDGILLFEISNRRVWDKPLEEQARLEEEWVKELNSKYEAKINQKVLKNIKKYIAAKQTK
jgi:peptidyl-prolyl cis-trans isomerase SurA